MENVKRWILHNWKQKLIALLGGVILWFYVNQSISSTKTISGIPIRIENLAPGKTIEGLLPNHLLRHKATLTLAGNKQLLDLIEASDLEVHLNAADAPAHWLIQITNDDLVSLNPAINVDGITSITHQDLFFEISSLETARIPVKIMPPRGHAPNGYELLGIWPNHLFQTVSGPAEQIEILKEEGLELHFDLDDISIQEINELPSHEKGFFQDEISFPIPSTWKMVRIPFKQAWETINDPEASKLHIEFLRREYIPLNQKVPIRLFYPAKYSNTINPETRQLGPSPLIHFEKGTAYVETTLYSYGVSRLFLDIVKDHIEIVVTAKPIDTEHSLRWSVEFIEPQILEDRYVDYLQTRYDITQNKQHGSQREGERRRRFREYMHSMGLYTAPKKPLKLESKIEGNHILIIEGK